MSFKLIIDIRGLCLLVPHAGSMHVLLPDETAHGDHGAMGAHFARFRFDAKYNATGSSRTYVDLGNLRWNLADLLAGTSAMLTLPPVVVDVARYVRPKGLEKHQLRAGQQLAVKSHIVLNHGGWTCYGPVPYFDIGPHTDVPMASMLRWSIDMPGADLPWQFRDLHTDAPAPTIEALRPVNGEIRMELRHAPAGLETAFCNSAAPTHFPAYYPLFKGHGPMPRCRNKLDQGTCADTVVVVTDSPSEKEENAASEEKNKPAPPAPNVFTCMIGRTDMDSTST